MISFDFEYYKPSSITEAVTLYHEFINTGKQAIYYGGGTEFISRARLNEIIVDAVIDLKAIPECNELRINENQIIIGSTTTLTKVAEANIFPLLTEIVRSIATHTARNKITIGGNLSSKLIYREAVLPFLLSDSQVVLAGKNGIRKTSMNELFQNELMTNADEFIVQLLVDEKYSKYPYSHIKKTKHSKVDYPVVSIAGFQVENKLRVAISGACSFPFRSKDIENDINDTSLPYEKRISNIISHLPGEILNDMHASTEYRQYLLENSLLETLERLEVGSS